jgi:hypothetical protein
VIMGLIMYGVVSHPDARVICQVTKKLLDSDGNTQELKSTYRNGGGS